MSAVIPSAFSFESFSDEADRYLSQYEAIKNIVQQVGDQIPSRLKDAYFARIKYPIYSAAAMATKWLEWKRAKLSDKNPELQLTASIKSLAAYEQIQDLTDYYNTKLSDGKWQYLMSDHPRDLLVFEKPSFDNPPTKQQVDGYKASHKSNKHRSFEIRQDDSFIVRNASNFDNSSFKPQPEPMLGHSMNSVALPKAEVLTYQFTALQSGAALLRTAVIPTHPNDDGDIRYSVQIDQQKPIIISFRQMGRTEAWKQNVLRGQAVALNPIILSKGRHQLKIKALDDHVIFDQWMIDFKRERKSYLFPVAPVEIP